MLAHEIFISTISPVRDGEKDELAGKMHYRVLLLDAAVKVINLYV